jgi:hypothetical protein
MLRRLAIIVPLVVSLGVACGSKPRGGSVDAAVTDGRSTDAPIADATLSVSDATRSPFDARATATDGARLDAASLDAPLPDAARPDAARPDAAAPDAAWLCDTTTTGCPDCTTCANSTDCKAPYDACQADSDCKNLLTCIPGCSGDSTCIGNCDNTYSAGVGLALAYEDCAVCACGTQCNDSSLCR